MYQRYEFSILLYWQLHFTWYNFYDGKQQKNLRNIYIYIYIYELIILIQYANFSLHPTAKPR